MASPIVMGSSEVLFDMSIAIADGDYAIGISYFLVDDLPAHIELIWKTEIVPYLEEYFFDQPGTARSYTWDRVAGGITEQW